MGSSDLVERSTGGASGLGSAGGSVVQAVVAAARVLPADLVVIEPGAGTPAYGAASAIVEAILRSLCCSVLLVPRPARPQSAVATSARNPHLQ
jgi:hypothetical protein